MSNNILDGGGQSNLGCIQIQAAEVRHLNFLETTLFHCYWTVYHPWRPAQIVQTCHRGLSALPVADGLLVSFLQSKI